MWDNLFQSLMNGIEPYKKLQQKTEKKYYNETLAKAFPELVTIKKNFFTGVSSVMIENTKQLEKELKKLYKKDINVIIK